MLNIHSRESNVSYLVYGTTVKPRKSKIIMEVVAATERRANSFASAENVKFAYDGAARCMVWIVFT